MYSIDLAGSISQSLASDFGPRIAAAFMFSFSVITANTLGEGENARETMLERALEAARILDLPVDFVSNVFRVVEEGEEDAGMVIYSELQNLKLLLH